MTVQVSPIAESDLPRVGEFLHEHLNRRLSADTWAAAVRVPWKVDAPDHGFMLLDGDEVVGVHLATYSERLVDGAPERFCNLGAWSVLPAYRLHSLRLLRALLAQDGVHFTDLSPIPAVQRLNRRLGFRDFDTTTALVPHLPWPSWPGRHVISADPALIEATLSGPELEIYHDHAGALAARHLVLISGDRWCYVMFRRDRRRNLPLFASILHVSHPAVFRELAHPLARHLLLHHGALAGLVDQRVVAHRPRLSVLLPGHRPKMFRSPYLGPHQIDYLYSELACAPW